MSAKRLVNAVPAPTPAVRRWPSVAVVGAAAAAVLLMVISRQAPTASSPRMRSAPIPSAANSTTLAVVMPAREAVVTPAGVRFMWRASESVVEYTLTVLDADGRARWTTSTSDTSVALPDSVVLAPGAEIHWYVDGLKSDGRSVGTGRQRFTTR